MIKDNKKITCKYFEEISKEKEKLENFFYDFQFHFYYSIFIFSNLQFNVLLFF